MDDQLVRELYHRLQPHVRPRPRRGCHPDQRIVFLLLLAAVRGRSVRWVLCRANLPLWLWRLPLPSSSCMSRRLRSPSVQRLLAGLNAEYRDRLPRTAEKRVDGRPLTVGHASGDPDATFGRVGRGWAKGYKLHVLADAAGPIEVFAVTPLNAGEATIARCDLVPRAGVALKGTLVRADANYDSVALYAAVADTGGRLIAGRRKPGRGVSRGHPQHPDRLAAIRELEQTGGQSRRRRADVERILGHTTVLPYGLSSLPPFVRRLPRVRLWVAAKLLLYHLHLCLTCEQNEAA